MNDKNRSVRYLGPLSVALLGLAVVALVLAKFLWAFTLWYEWIALGSAIALLFLANAIGGWSKRTGEEQSEGEEKLK